MGDRGDSAIASDLSQVTQPGRTWPSWVQMPPGVNMSPPTPVSPPAPQAPPASDGTPSPPPPPVPTIPTYIPPADGHGAVYNSWAGVPTPPGYHWDTHTNSYQLNPDYLAGSDGGTTFPVGAMNQLYGGWNG
jgi:hypothetical protein